MYVYLYKYKIWTNVHQNINWWFLCSRIRDNFDYFVIFMHVLFKESNLNGLLS